MNTHMQARPPPMKVILVILSGDKQENQLFDTDMFEYTDGNCALVTLSGSGDSHRSGFHS